MGTIKIVRIVTRLNIGGPAINTILLSEGLNKFGFETRLVAGSVGRDEGDMHYFAKEHNVEPLAVNDLAREISFLKDLKAFWSVYKIIRKEKPQIVHTHTAKAGLIGRASAILAGVPVKVHTFHGHVFDGYFNSVSAKFFIFIEKILAVFTDKLIAVSDSVASDIYLKYKIAKKDKVAVINLGFDLGRFLDADKAKGRLRKELGLNSDILLVGIVGRLVSIKDHKTFLGAAKKILAVSNYSSTVKFIIVGDGELRWELENYAQQLGITDKVIFLGWRKDLEAVYADLDIACLVSLNEGTPVSIIEAMASAKPVVATSVGGVKDIVKDEVNGKLVNAKDVNGFSEAVMELLKDKAKRIKMGYNGREFVIKNFNRDRLIDDVKNLYEDLLKKRGILCPRY